MSKADYDANQATEWTYSDNDAVPIIIAQGGSMTGPLPTRVLIILQYWQKSPEEKIMVKGDVYFQNFIMPEQIVQRGKVKFEYNLDVLWWGMSHRDVMINFVFPEQFYVALYILIGIVAILLVWIQWLYHYILSEIRYPPRLFNFQYISFMFPPIVKGLILVLLPVVPAGFTLTAIVRGHMFGATMPWKRCDASNTPDAECKLGVFDHFAASWDPES
jgi:hypothetical protein